MKAEYLWTRRVSVHGKRNKCAEARRMTDGGVHRLDRHVASYETSAGRWKSGSDWIYCGSLSSPEQLSDPGDTWHNHIPTVQCLLVTQVSKLLQGVPEKIAQSLCTTILQLYVTESCGFQQNVQKKFLYTTKASAWTRLLNILCFAAGKWSIWKQN